MCLFHHEPLAGAGEHAPLRHYAVPRTVVERSHRRCAQSGLQPDLDRLAALPPDQLQVLQARHAALQTNARPYVSRLVRETTGQTCLAIVTDPQGVALQIEGNPAMLQAARAYGLQTGTLFDERHAGTNAIALALQDPRPLYLRGADHYLRFFRHWFCAVTPIYTAGSERALLGFLDISLHEQGQIAFCFAALLSTADLIGARMTPAAAGSDDGVSPPAPPPAAAQLPPRQWEVLFLLAQGYTVPQTAKRLQVEESTVKYHRAELYKRLGVKSALACINRAKALKLLPDVHAVRD